MNKLVNPLVITAVAVCMVPSLAHADANYALDYGAPRACPAREAFSDGVSAELGFVPWVVASANVVKVNIKRRDGQFVGTVTAAGRTKTFEDATCARVVERLITTTSLLVEVMPQARREARSAAPKRRLERLEARPDDAEVSVAFTSAGPIKIYEIVDEQQSMLTVGTSNGVAYGNLYSRRPRFLCTAPCETTLREGPRTLVFDQESSMALAREDIVISRPAQIDINYSSRDGERWKYRRNGWLLIGGGLVLGCTAAIYGLSPQGGFEADGSRNTDMRSPALALVGGLIVPVAATLIGMNQFRKMPTNDHVRLDIQAR